MSMSKLRLHTNKKNRQPLPAQRPQVTQNVKGTVEKGTDPGISATSITKTFLSSQIRSAPGTASG